MKKSQLISGLAVSGLGGLGVWFTSETSPLAFLSTPQDLTSYGPCFTLLTTAIGLFVSWRGLKAATAEQVQAVGEDVRSVGAKVDHVNRTVQGQGAAAREAVREEGTKTRDVLEKSRLDAEEIEAAVQRALQTHESLKEKDTESEQSDAQADLTFANAARRTLQAAEPKEREARRALTAIPPRPIDAADQLMIAARQQHAEADDARCEAQKLDIATADRYRRAGALYYGVEDGKALNAYREAAKLDTSDIWAMIYLGRLEQTHGEGLAAAAAVFDAALKVVADERDRSVLFNELGNVRVSQGDLTGALESYEAGLLIRERLAASDEENAGWQRDLSVSHERIGDVRVSQGDLTGALASYEAGLLIAERLAASDEENAEWQRDLSVSHNKIGDVRVSQGDLTGALESYEAGLLIRERLAASDEGHAGWQRDLSVSHDKIGNVRVSQGDLTGALESYEAGLLIAERLAASDEGNAEWQADLAASYGKLGQLHLAKGDADRALELFHLGRAIVAPLAESSGHVTWQGYLEGFDKEIARAEALKEASG